SLDKTKETDNPELVYLLKEGKRYRVPFKNLSQADQDYVTEFRKGGRNLNEDVGLELDDDDDSRSVEVVPAGKRYALLIGVNKYAKPIKSLQYCVKDMELLADSFQKSGMPKENIFLVTDDSPAERLPTGANIRRQIENITGIMEPSDQLIVAFSGHGAMVEGKSYLCPSDTDVKNKNTIVSRDWVFEQLDNCKAKQKIFIIDACRNEVSFGSVKALGQVRTLDDPIGADTHGFVLIASCDKKQQSWEHPNLQHGVFTYFLAEGLAGAVKDEDGYVSVMNLFQYASAKTKKYVLREFNEVQVPTFRQGDEMTDFCLAKLESPQPTPIQPTPTTPTPAPVVEQRPAVTPAPASTPAPPDETPASVQALPLDTPGAKPGERRTVTVNGVEFAFRWCPPGTFKMGAPDAEEGRDGDEKQYQVTLTKGFWMMETEVTQKQWKAVMGTNPSEFKGDDLPVENVSWNDCQEFCKKCAQLGLPVQLPTDAQWEYACRAGTTGAYAGNLDDMAWYTSNSGLKTHPVGTKKPNAWGMYDMHGNVWEWCEDWYGYYPSESVTDPVGPSSGSVRVRRGGSWSNDARICRSAYRDSFVPGYLYCNLGFRCARSITRPEN
ncbi:MAG: SUMF1/EgtB/PvdO family nonheme iron enzyme, partial [Thermoguttaceae bacterium]|nr:SUMF1/EgtB/PvdO family nonheme iron enzyme [Thermoguttaceae bacterium]